MVQSVKPWRQQRKGNWITGTIPKDYRMAALLRRDSNLRKPQIEPPNQGTCKSWKTASLNCSPCSMRQAVNHLFNCTYVTVITKLRQERVSSTEWNGMQTRWLRNSMKKRTKRWLCSLLLPSDHILCLLWTRVFQEAFKWPYFKCFYHLGFLEVKK